MFGFFKRSPPPAKRPIKANSSSRVKETPTEPATLPQAIERSDDSAWQDWEDSEMLITSQLQPLDPSKTVHDRNKEAPSQFGDLDPFASLRSKKTR